MNRSCVALVWPKRGNAPISARSKAERLEAAGLTPAASASAANDGDDDDPDVDGRRRTRRNVSGRDCVALAWPGPAYASNSQFASGTSCFGRVSTRGAGR